MRQEWSPEELLANWTLVDGDWHLVANRSGATRLGFSLSLKFFELAGRFPGVLEEVPLAAVRGRERQLQACGIAPLSDVHLRRPCGLPVPDR